jgi:hypothetical protein
MDKRDRIALTRALAICRDEDEGRAEQIDAKLEDEPWAEVAMFATFCCQTRSLALQPWDLPPCCADEDGDSDGVDCDAIKLLRTMLAAGVSRFDPDSMTALEAANGYWLMASLLR